MNNSKDLRSVQLACLEILKKYVEVCEKHGLKYYLAYGTLLGAIRHNGYIPWDDDIDVWMSRPDLERFLEIANVEMRPYVINYYTIDNDASFKYRSQPCIEDHHYEVSFSLGGKIKPGYIWIDIMPLDGMPKSKFLQRLQCIRFRIMYMLIGFARSARIGAFNEEKKRGLSKVGVKINKVLRIGKLLNVEKLLSRFDRIRRKYSYTDSDYVVGTTTTYTSKAIFLKEWFNESRKSCFEGISLSIPSKAERILESLYGNYMELPPEEKRDQSHFII